tara:strand:- start:348 stop:710 length:363 start_codon:yes stop_codon:yes gene_type:complete
VKRLVKNFRLLIIINGLISLMISYEIFYKNLYNIELKSLNMYIISIYGLLWFYSLFKLYKLTNLGLRLYIALIILGFLFNFMAEPDKLSKLIYILTLSEHLIIGCIVTISYATNIKSKFA